MENQHIMEVHAGKVNGQPALYFKQLQTVLALGDEPLAETQDVHFPAPLHHLVEVHGLLEVTGWQLWNHRGDFKIFTGFLGCDGLSRIRRHQ